MRRVLAALLVVLLPLQWGWALAAATCIDGGWNAVPAHVSGVDAHGHGPAHAEGFAHDHGHAHAPAGPAGHADVAPAQADEGDAGAGLMGCAVCHLPVAAVVGGVWPTLPAPAEATPAVGPATAVPEPPLQLPFRPPAGHA